MGGEQQCGKPAKVEVEEADGEPRGAERQNPPPEAALEGEAGQQAPPRGLSAALTVDKKWGN